MPKEVIRQRAYRNGNLVTVLKKGRRSSDIRTAFGFVEYDVPNKELEFLDADADRNEPDVGSFKFKTPTSQPS